MTIENGIGYYTRCLHCYSREALEGADVRLAERVLEGNLKTAAALGWLQSAVERLADPTVVWKLCRQHAAAQRAARAVYDGKGEGRLS